MAVKWTLAARAWAGRIFPGSLTTVRLLQPLQATYRLGGCLKLLWNGQATSISPFQSIFHHVKWSSTATISQKEPGSKTKRCVLCDLEFPTAKVYREHVKTSSQHKHCCLRCKLSFESDEALQRHLTESTKHNICTECDGKPDFGSPKKLEKHKKKVHRDRSTPIHLFFCRFECFKYDPSLPPAISFRQLCDHMRWNKDDPQKEQARSEYRKALKDEVRVWFGNENDLLAWHTLCKAIRIENPPDSIKKCRQRVRKTHVNIIDLIDWASAGKSPEGVEIFKTVKDLRVYACKTKKYFPKEEMENDEGETNIVLKHLLRYLLRPEPRRKQSKPIA